MIRALLPFLRASQHPRIAMQKVEILLNCNKDGLPLRSLALRGQFGGQGARQ
jgi:hypothetical protein